MLLIKNGRVVDPASKTDAPRDVLLDGEVVKEVGEPGKFGAIKDAEVFDAGGMIRGAMNEGKSTPINIRITGKNQKTARAVAERIKAAVVKVDGVVDARIIQRLDYPEYVIDVDRAAAADVGLSQEDVIKNVVAAFNSSILKRFKKSNAAIFLLLSSHFSHSPCSEWIPAIQRSLHSVVCIKWFIFCFYKFCELINYKIFFKTYQLLRLVPVITNMNFIGIHILNHTISVSMNLNPCIPRGFSFKARTHDWHLGKNQWNSLPLRV